ncbi:AAA family ATPase [Microbulbifer magnicolonia]|uniref:AAA family ATPase n=1 Tax=Microbulbifer magnicolonia TaxID=3109744 RepID=UPI002B40D6E2|nr:AAA family ATPase [Microbulbifer sp. GG15]
MTEAYAPPLIQLTPADSVVCRPIRWEWPGYLARGKLHILAGSPGTGKTTIALAIAAVNTRGGQWPDATMATPGNVLIWSGEDDPADTLVPRLRAAGADLSRVFIVGDVLSCGEQRAFDPAVDLLTLERAAEEIGDISLMICDPVVSAVAGDSHKNTEVRRALQPIVNLASRLDCAVLGISHFSKGTAGRDPTERVTGSIAFSALARVVIVTAKGEDGRRIMARAKSNIGPDGGGFAYSLEQVDIDGLSASRVTWGQPLEGTARELLGDAEDESSPRDEAATWLEELLWSGPVPVNQIKAEANGAGTSWRTVERAKAELGVIAERISDGKGGRGFWQWRIPDNTDSSKAASLTSKSGGLVGDEAPRGIQAADSNKSATDNTATAKAANICNTATNNQGVSVLLEASNTKGCREIGGARPPNYESGDLVAVLANPVCPRCAGEGCQHCLGGAA